MGVPVQVPGVRVSCWPTVAVPVIAGGVWLAGGVVVAAMTAVGVVVAGRVPAVLVAVTVAVRVEPMSVLVGV